MGSTNKIYISYTGSDNASPYDMHQGWVDSFKKSLLETYEQVFGDILMCVSCTDENSLSVGQTDADVFICILSPEYITDKKCLQEIKWFAQNSSNRKEKTGKNHICKIVKQPVALEAQPESLRGLLNYNFFPALSDKTGREMSEDIIEWMATDEYRVKMADVVYDLYEIFQQYQSTANLIHDYVHPVAREAVYLAETGPDLLVQRHIIKRELQKYGYRVLPEQKLPSGITEIEATVRRDLAASRLSIHLIGEIQAETDQSIVEIQNKFATEHNLTFGISKGRSEKDPAFSQLIWMAPAVHLTNGKQKEFIESLKRSSENQLRTEFLQTPLHDLRKVIGGGFVFNQNPTEAEVKPSGSRLPEIYFIYDKGDSLYVLPLIEVFRSKGFNVALPVFEGDVLEIRKTHINNLISFDIAIIYKNKVNEQWLRIKVSDLLKAPGYGRKKVIMDKVVITDEGTVIDKAYYEGYGFTLISDAASYASKLVSGLDAKTKKQGWIN